MSRVPDSTKHIPMSQRPKTTKKRTAPAHVPVFWICPACGTTNPRHFGHCARCSRPPPRPDGPIQWAAGYDESYDELIYRNITKGRG